MSGGRVIPGAVILQAEYTFSVLSLVKNKHQLNPPIIIQTLHAQAGNKQASITSLRGSVRAPEGFSEGKPNATKPGTQTPRFCSRGFAQGKSRGSPHCPAAQRLHPGILLRGQLFHSAPKIFNSSSDYQSHEVYFANEAGLHTVLLHSVLSHCTIVQFEGLTLYYGICSIRVSNCT